MIDPISSTNNLTDYNSLKSKAEEAKEGAFESQLEKAIKDKDEEKLKKACRDLEAVFVNMMFKQMRNTIQKSQLMGGGYAEGMYEDMLYEKYAEEASKNKGIGIGDILYKQLSKNMNRENEEKDAE